MKKIVTTALIAAVLAAALAGCGGAGSDNSGTGAGGASGSGESSNANNSDNADSNDSNASGDSSNTDSAAEAKAPAEKLSAVFTQFDCFSPTEGMPMMVAAPDLEALAEVFPMPDDPETEQPAHCVSSFEDGALVAQAIGLTGLNLDDCEDYVLACPMISAQLKQIVIVKPKAGREEAVKTALSEYADASKISDPTEYPAWEAERAGTHFGETSDGCFYVVVAAEGAEMGAAIENA